MRTDQSASTGQQPLPPGQRALAEFPRFGVAAFAERPIRNRDLQLEIAGALPQTVVLTEAEFAQVPRVKLIADFHCAAGWSHRSLKWEGFRFRDVWETFIAPQVQQPVGEHRLAVLRCQDGYRTALPLADLLRPDVLIVDRLNSQPLTLEHGAPVRLIAPAHYGYKSAKHLRSIELWPEDREYRPLMPRLMDHPRARVAVEERGRFLPGWLLRYLFRPFIRPLIRKVELATERGRLRESSLADGEVGERSSH
jgi:DMSO/TMAO reductase YedYZ molybdopterin-dependent catalytic subunit